jgi:hypothetical protein
MEPHNIKVLFVCLPRHEVVSVGTLLRVLL